MNTAGWNVKTHINEKCQQYRYVLYRGVVSAPQSDVIPITFHVLLPKITWHWTPTSELHVRFGDSGNSYGPLAFTGLVDVSILLPSTDLWLCLLAVQGSWRWFVWDDRYFSHQEVHTECSTNGLIHLLHQVPTKYGTFVWDAQGSIPCSCANTSAA